MSTPQESPKKMAKSIFRCGVQTIFTVTLLGPSAVLPSHAAGLTAAGVTESGQLVVSANQSGVRVDSTSDFLIDENAIGNDLLAVGPGFVNSDQSGAFIVIFNKRIGIDIGTTFPRGMISPGDYVAVSGMSIDDALSVATSVVRLGGDYVRGVSTIYLRGKLRLDSKGGTITVADTAVAEAFPLPQSSIDPTGIVEMIGVEGLTGSVQPVLIPYSIEGLEIPKSQRSEYEVAGINGSGARGINGSGARGINGSGARGINGSGARGINGSGARGINGSGARSLDDGGNS